MEINKETIEKLVRQVLNEKIDGSNLNNSCPIKSVSLPSIHVGETDRLDTGYSFDKVYTKDVFSLEESPRLGCGIMEMTNSTFDWTLNYDEIDYVIEGQLDIIYKDKKFSASKGEIILIPKGSKISFSVGGYARFMYVTYPADWENQ